jgi:ABC-type Zn uptake system ZnuABC Zn-binding protein ZnuA
MRGVRGSFGWLLMLLALAAGCDRQPASAPAAPRKLLVLGTSFPLAQIASEVGGAEVQTEWLIEQGQSLDSLQPTQENLQRLRRADFVITTATGEEWAADGFDDPVHANSIVRVDLLASAAGREGVRPLWLDPAVAKELARVIAQRLALKRPAQAAAFRQNAERFAQSIDSVMKEYDPKSVRLWGKNVLVLSKDYSALTKSFGMIEMCPVEDSPLRLSDEELALLRSTAKNEPIAALLVESSTPLGVQQDLIRKVGVPVIALDSLGSSSGVGRNSYLSILRYNLEQLARLLA